MLSDILAANDWRQRCLYKLDFDHKAETTCCVLSRCSMHFKIWIYLKVSTTIWQTMFFLLSHVISFKHPQEQNSESQSCYYFTAQPSLNFSLAWHVLKNIPNHYTFKILDKSKLKVIWNLALSQMTPRVSLTRTPPRCPSRGRQEGAKGGRTAPWRWASCHVRCAFK